MERLRKKVEGKDLSTLEPEMRQRVEELLGEETVSEESISKLESAVTTLRDKVASLGENMEKQEARIEKMGGTPDAEAAENLAKAKEQHQELSETLKDAEQQLSELKAEAEVKEPVEEKASKEPQEDATESTKAEPDTIDEAVEENPSKPDPETLEQIDRLSGAAQKEIDNVADFVKGMGHIASAVSDTMRVLIKSWKDGQLYKTGLVRDLRLAMGGLRKAAGAAADGAAKLVQKLIHAYQKWRDNNPPPTDPNKPRGKTDTKFSESKGSEGGSAKVNSGLHAWVKDAVNGGRLVESMPEVGILEGRNPTLMKGGIHRDIVLDFEHTRHILKTHPDIMPEDIAALPDLLNRPRAVFKNKGKENSWEVILDARDSDGNPLLVALNNGELKDGHFVTKITEVSSLYGKRQSASHVVKNLLAGNGTYLAEKEVARLQASLALHPRGPIPRDVGTSNAKTQVFAAKGGSDLYPGSLQKQRAGVKGNGSIPSEREITIASDNGNVKLNLPTDAAERLFNQHFSENNAPMKGSNASDISKSLKDAFASPDAFDKRVTIVQSMSDIPEGAIKTKAGSKVAGFTKDGRVTLIADNIPPGQELGVFLHEAGVHLGMKEMIGEARMGRLSGQVESWAKSAESSLEARIAKKALERAENSSSAREHHGEELIAYFVEEAVNAGINPITAIRGKGGLAQWFRSMWASVKTALRKLGFEGFDKLTAQNVVDLAYGAARLQLSEKNVQRVMTEVGASRDKSFVRNLCVVKAHFGGLLLFIQQQPLRATRQCRA